ncbi:MAG: hypothetical protein NZ529_08145 [Cytophagaceae bacterium]|nr:hypothetical protein [Cytophagaceae bacterium]MDW8456753.1 hypothetical protein [Cytophagaceae bacterium]
MKTITKKIFILILLVSTLATCNKRKPDDVVIPHDKHPEYNEYSSVKGTLKLHIHNYIDETEVEAYGTTYTFLNNGRKISISMAQLYLSNIHLIRPDGSTYHVKDTIILKTQNELAYSLGKIPAGNYKSIRFDVGLSPEVNALSPGAGKPSPLNASNMWFGPTAQPDGYIFMNVQGKIDTTTSASAPESHMASFIYRIGTNENLKTVTMPKKNYTIMPDKTNFLHLKINYAKLFSSIDLRNPSNLIVYSAADNSSSLAKTLTQNIISMFSYEK